MVALGCLLVYTFGYYRAGILVTVHMVNNSDNCDEPENEGYESEP